MEMHKIANHVPMCILLQWCNNERDSVSNHQSHDCLLIYIYNRLFRRRSKKTAKLCVNGLCEGNSPVTGEFPAQRASNAENVSIWWLHHDCGILLMAINVYIEKRGMIATAIHIPTIYCNYTGTSLVCMREANWFSHAILTTQRIKATFLPNLTHFYLTYLGTLV